MLALQGSGLQASECNIAQSSKPNNCSLRRPRTVTAVTLFRCHGYEPFFPLVRRQSCNGFFRCPKPVCDVAVVDESGEVSIAFRGLYSGNGISDNCHLE